MLGSKLKRKIDLKLLEDAEVGFRKHLGASIIGQDCPRKVAYSFRWALRPSWKADDLEDKDIDRYGCLMRLFWRGHEEEPRFIKLLESIGCEVSAFTEDGNQHRITGLLGHYGGSLDCKILKVPKTGFFPDKFKPRGKGLGEFKTHNAKSFNKLEKEGMRSAKNEHYVQMVTYMWKQDLAWGLYMAVCKDDDRLHLEFLERDDLTAQDYENRAERVIFGEMPLRIGKDASTFGCNFCDYRHICHHDEVPEVNCRTCAHATPVENGEWVCGKAPKRYVIPDNVMATGCKLHVFRPDMLNAEYLDGDGTNARYVLHDRSVMIQGPGGVRSKDLCSLAGTK